ncbi:MAG: HIT domain-containing protein [Thermoleophilia bacterium]|nr:HIT domain-containing protein [Thermoleophilia bacterium]
MSDDCVFCTIAAGGLPADLVHEDDLFMAFRPLENLADVHALVIPRAHVSSIADVASLNDATRARMPVFIAAVASRLGLDAGGYRVVTNHGPDARQSVFHLHWHVLGGQALSESM